MDASDRKILNLLYAGLNDASIARQLAIGHRTVQRRVQRLMELLQANGRVALGARAQELGLLRAPHTVLPAAQCAHLPPVVPRPYST
ncbi:winged helix-turn-helix transcriptional regulator [Streptomyces sp. F001]|nr:winged helix-turn-helix transcriptional regulator [Streptomyces sp. F001]